MKSPKTLPMVILFVPPRKSVLLITIIASSGTVLKTVRVTNSKVVRVTHLN